MIKELEYKDFLTNELLSKRFANQFDLVRHAIQLAEQTIKRGGSLPTAGESENLAFQILAAIAEDKDILQDVVPTISLAEEAEELLQKKMSKGTKEGRFERKRKALDWNSDE